LKTAFSKTVFVLVVFGLTLVLLIPATLVFEALTPVIKDARGHVHDSRIFTGLIASTACLVVSNRITSLGFRRCGLTDERWSIFQGRESRRPR